MWCFQLSNCSDFVKGHIMSFQIHLGSCAYWDFMEPFLLFIIILLFSGLVHIYISHLGKCYNTVFKVPVFCEPRKFTWLSISNLGDLTSNASTSESQKEGWSLGSDGSHTPESRKAQFASCVKLNATDSIHVSHVRKALCRKLLPISYRR